MNDYKHRYLMTVCKICGNDVSEGMFNHLLKHWEIVSTESLSILEALYKKYFETVEVNELDLDNKK